MERERGSRGASKRETEKEVREDKRRAESEGWMYWSMSGGACSRTRGQKLGILETVCWRVVKRGAVSFACWRTVFSQVN